MTRISHSLVAAGLLTCALVLSDQPGFSQVQDETIHRRGKIWEAVRNDGYVGSSGAWDFITSAPLGLYPGFEGYRHPTGGETNAYPDVYVNSNFHNFRAGPIIGVKNMLVPDLPPRFTPVQAIYELSYAGLQGDPYGVMNNRTPIVMKKNYIGSAGFDARQPEESAEASWHTNTGITVRVKSYVWSYPGYSDFIIYDYTFKNTGVMVSTITNDTVPGFPSQTLSNVFIAFHGAVAVSTKSQINFHNDLDGVAAGGFGYIKETFHDKYYLEDEGTLVYSMNFNGGKSPPTWDTKPKKANEAWKYFFGDELESPAAFGWMALYASPRAGTPRLTPKPDVLRIDSHKGGKLLGTTLDMENLSVGGKAPKKKLYDFVANPDTQKALGNNGDRMNIFTLSYGPYTIAPGDSLRFIFAEIAGVMDYHDVIAGDPNGHFPDSSIAAIRRNAANVRNAVLWGRGAVVDGIPMAADVPDGPPPPSVIAANGSIGLDTAAINVSWDKSAELVQTTDGVGNPFFNGAVDLDGYRVYRSTDFQYVSENELPALRGAAWDLIADIPRSDFNKYYDSGIGRYIFLDKGVKFGFRYGYYVQAYWSHPRSWTSINGTVVPALPELANGDVNRTNAVVAAPGPVNSFDVFVAPNPHVFGDEQRSFGRNNPYGLEFRNLPERCTIRIYTLMGDLVKILEHKPDASGGVYGSEPWDQRSDSGLLVAPGLYLYHVKSDSPANTITGKFMIIR